MADRIQLRRDTKANWESYNPILLEGEPGHVLDYPNLYKMGDGIHAWNDLPYRGYNGTVLQEVQKGEDNAVPSSSAVYNFKDIFAQLSKNNGIDLCFIDKNLNCLVYFKDGHIVTKNFDSRNIAANLNFNVVTADNGIDFSINDSNGNSVLALIGGEVVTKNFNSKNVATSRKLDIRDFAIGDPQGNYLLLVKDGHIITKNFDSRVLEPVINIYKNKGYFANDWSGKNVCFLGDSIVDNGFVVNVIKQVLKCNVYNRGWSGAMITPTRYLQGSDLSDLSKKGYAFTNRCDLPENNSPDANHGGMPSADLIDLVVIHGGGNDYGHGCQTSRTIIELGNADEAMGNTINVLPEGETDPYETEGSSFASALKYTCYKVRQKYPNIPVAICTIFRTYDYGTLTGNNELVPVSSHTEYLVHSDMSVTPYTRTYRDGVKTKDDFNNIIRMVARQFGMYVIDFDLFGMPSYGESFGDLYYVPKESTGHGDLTHPSENYGAWNYGIFMSKQIMGLIPYMDKSRVNDNSGEYPEDDSDV